MRDNEWVINVGFEKDLYNKRPVQQKVSADSFRKVEVITTAKDDLIGWHRFQRDDDGTTSVSSIGKHKIG